MTNSTRNLPPNISNVAVSRRPEAVERALTVVRGVTPGTWRADCDDDISAVAVVDGSSKWLPIPDNEPDCMHIEATQPENMAKLRTYVEQLEAADADKDARIERLEAENARLREACNSVWLFCEDTNRGDDAHEVAKHCRDVVGFVRAALQEGEADE